MMTRRWLPLAVAFALALALGWRAWPTDRAARDGAFSSPQAQPDPSARRTPPPADPRTPPDAPAPAALKTGIAACDDYVERTMTCAQLPADAKIAVAEATKAWAELTAAGPQPDLEASCRATASVQGDALSAMGC